MRKAAAKTFFILALGAALCACLSFSAYAFADDGPAATEYPETFRFELSLSDIIDYDIEGDSYIFASSKGVTAVRGEDMAEYGFKATSVEINKDVFYCSDGSATFYSEDGATWISREEYNFKVSDSFYIWDNLYFYNLYDGGISITEIGTGNYDQDTLAGFSLLKECDDRLFAVCEDCLYEIDGYVATPVEISYTDYSAAESVSTGTASLSSWSEALQSPDDGLAFDVGTLKEGAFASEIDLSSLSDDTFSVLETFEITEESSPKAGDQVLILCETGNAYVVATGLSVYLLKIADVEKNVESVSVSPAEGSGTVSEPTLCSYLIPVICDGAKKDELDAVDGSKIQICGSLKREDLSFLYCDFYLVSYETDGETGYGFVPERYVTVGGFDEDLTEFEDENYSDDNYILTVVLILIVITLVLVAAGYIVFIATRSKKKGKAGEEKADEDEEGREDDD